MKKIKDIVKENPKFIEGLRFIMRQVPRNEDLAGVTTLEDFLRFREESVQAGPFGLDSVANAGVNAVLDLLFYANPDDKVLVLSTTIHELRNTIILDTIKQNTDITLITTNKQNIEAEILERFNNFLDTRREAIQLKQEDKEISAFLTEKYALGVINTLRACNVRSSNLEENLLNACKDFDPDYDKNRNLRYKGKLRFISKVDEH